MEGDREGTELGRIVIIFLSFYLNSFFFFTVLYQLQVYSKVIQQFFFRFFSHIGYYKIIEYNSLCYTIGPVCLFYI